MPSLFLIAGAAFAGLGVMLGAFGAHGLEGQVTPERIETFETAVQYHMYHALALLIVGWAVDTYGAGLVSWAGYCFIAGIVIFSGSLYLLVITDTPWLGAITPIGGVSFIAGWALLVWSFVQS